MQYGNLKKTALTHFYHISKIIRNNNFADAKMKVCLNQHQPKK